MRPRRPAAPRLPGPRPRRRPRPRPGPRPLPGALGPWTGRSCRHESGRLRAVPAASLPLSFPPLSQADRGLHFAGERADAVDTQRASERGSGRGDGRGVRAGEGRRLGKPISLARPPSLRALPRPLLAAPPRRRVLPAPPSPAPSSAAPGRLRGAEGSHSHTLGAHN